MSLSHFLLRRLIWVLGLWLSICLVVLVIMGNQAVQKEYENAQDLVGQIQKALVTRQPVTELDLMSIQASLAQGKANLEKKETQTELLIMAIMLIAMASAGGLVVWFGLGRQLEQPLQVLNGWLLDYEHDAKQGKRLKADLPNLHLKELAALQHGIGNLIATLEKEQDRGKELITQVLKVQETERQTIAQDLHDHLGQILTSVSVNSATLSKRTSGALQETAQAIQDSAQEMMVWIRGSLKELKPHLLLEVSLKEAALDLTENWAKRRAWFVDFAWDDEAASLDEELGIHAFRILQEGLTNAARYSTNKQVSVAAGKDPETKEFVMIIRNDSAPGHEAIQPSLGLLGARERAQSVGGSLSWKKKGDQFTLVLRMPFQRIQK